MIRDIVALVAVPFAACAVFVAIHTYFGLHVLRRNVVFADLALAQLSALGATLAVALGHPPGSLAGFLYALLLTLLGAALLTASRILRRYVGQEAAIGILYVVATAATILVVDSAPQGAEHVKRMLVGSILGVGLDELGRDVLLYAAIALVHAAARRPFLAASAGTLRGASAVVWDFAFYATFGAVVTSSVAAAGVLLVFSFLIIPAVIGRLFAQGIVGALAIGWAAGTAAVVAGFAVSLAADLPTGATLVLALAAALILAGTVRLLFGEAARARRRRRRVRAAAAIALPGVLLALGLWSLASPAADQPLLALLERAGLARELFLDEAEAAQYAEARESEARLRAEVDGLNDAERARRWKGAPLSDEEVRRIASYQQSFNEMSRGERFVQDHLLTRARARERWVVSLPISAASAIILVILLRRRRRAYARLVPPPLAGAV